MATDLGKVGMRMRGDWNSSATYEVLDAVSYQGALYIAKQNVPANTTPTNTTYWQLAVMCEITPENEVVPTLDNGEHYLDGCSYIKYGHLVYLYISAKFSNNPTNTLLFTLPQGYRPKHPSEITVSGGGSYNAKSQCTIAKNGQVRVTSVDLYASGSGIIYVD